MTLTIEDDAGWQNFLWTGRDDAFRCVVIGKGLTDFELFDEFEHPRQTAPYQPEYICPLLKPDTIVVEDGNLVFYMDGGCLINQKSHRLVLAEAGIQQAVIPDGVTHITSYAFYRREQLKTVYMPDTVSIIEDHAFNMCTQLGAIRFSSQLKGIGKAAFADTSINTLQLPVTLIDIGESAFSCCSRIETIDMSGLQLDVIPCYLFCRCTALRSVAFMPTLKSIHYGAFHGCTNLSVIELPPSVQKIELDAFYDCSFPIVRIPSDISLDGDSRFLDFAFETNEYRFSTVGLAVFEGRVSILGNDSFDACDRVVFLDNPPNTVEDQAFANPPKTVYYLDEFSAVWSPNGETK